MLVDASAELIPSDLAIIFRSALSASPETLALTHEVQSVESYRDAKRKLFRLANKNKKGLRTGVINAEDPSSRFYELDISHPLTYGLKTGEIRATDIKATSTGSDFTVKSPALKDRQLKIHVNLPGSFNVYNALAAVGVGLALKMEPEQIERGIAALKSVEGRMTAIEAGQPFSVIKT